MYYVRRGAKSIVAAAVVALGAWWQLHVDGMTADEWGQVVALAIPAAAAVWGVPNAAKRTVTES